MRKKIVTLLILVNGLLLFTPVAVNAFDPVADIDCSKTPDSTVCKSKGSEIEGNIKAIINTLIYAVGIISVVSIVFGGIMYVTSSGSPENITKAKNTIIYAVIGIIVTALSFAIVNFVVDKF